MDFTTFQPNKHFQPSFLFAQVPISLNPTLNITSEHREEINNPKNSAFQDGRENFLSQPIIKNLFCDIYTLPELSKITYFQQPHLSKSFKNDMQINEQGSNISKLCEEIESLIDKALQSLDGKIGTLTSITNGSTSSQNIQKKISELSKLLRQQNKIWHSLVLLDKISEETFEIYRAFDKNIQKFYYVKQLKKSKDNESEFEKCILREVKLHLQLLKTGVTPFVLTIKLKISSLLRMNLERGL